MLITIRAPRDDDAAAIAALLNPIIEAGVHTIMEGPISGASQLAFMRDFPERGVLHVAADSDDRRLLGLQDVQPVSSENALRHVGEISTFVALDAQRRGIGRRLTAATFARARKLGYRKILATIRADNPPGLAFYREQGFEIVGTLRGHAQIRGRFVDEVLVECLLDAASSSR